MQSKRGEETVGEDGVEEKIKGNGRVLFFRLLLFFFLESGTPRKKKWAIGVPTTLAIGAAAFDLERATASRPNQQRE